MYTELGLGVPARKAEHRSRRGLGVGLAFSRDTAQRGEDSRPHGADGTVCGPWRPTEVASRRDPEQLETSTWLLCSVGGTKASLLPRLLGWGSPFSACPHSLLWEWGEESARAGNSHAREGEEIRWLEPS